MATVPVTLAAVPLTFPTTFPSTLPTTFPVNKPEKTVALTVPSLVQIGPPVLNLAGEIPPSRTITAPPLNCVVAPSTAPAANVAELIAAFKVAAVTWSLST